MAEQKKAQNTYDFSISEKKWQDYWIKKDIFRFKDNESKIFSIDTPPPTVSGEMHIGHSFGYAQMDFIARYKRMKGFNLFFPFGFDDNGLATERYVEKKTGKRAKSMSRLAFIQLCLKETKEAEQKLRQDWISLGLSCDWNIYYATIDENSRRVSQLSFIDLYEKGREYRKEAPTLWCPTCSTAVAQAEITDKSMESHFNDVVFRIEKEKLVVSTTRPELLPACVALLVHPEDKRAKELKGKKATVPLFNFEVPIILDERVQQDKGTGVVMCCTFGDLTDVEWFLAYSLPLKEAITKEGRMSSIAGAYEGMEIKEARRAIINDLKEKGLLVKQEDIRHFVNTHERCGTEIEILHSRQWFIKYLDLKDKFIELGKQLNWHPEFMRVRYENWVNGLQWDWCISRQRFFGVPFPIWYCKDCGEIILAEKDSLPVDPTIDSPPLKECPECGAKEFTPETDVMDTWATSALTVFIATRWKKDKAFFKKLFPMSLRENGHDIISFWLFNAVVKSYLHEGKLPWKDVMINGFVLDPKGQKMSKSKGNISKPQDVISQYGSDVLRYWAASKSLGEDILISDKDFITGKKLINKLWNASRFCAMHLGGKAKPKKPETLSKADKWLLFKLDKVIKEATESFEGYRFSRAKSAIEQFFWSDFCDNYLEIIKDRLYNPESYKPEEIESVRFTLYHALLTQLKLLAPFLCHVTEEIYQLGFKEKENLESIHLCPWPEELKLGNKEDFDAGELLVDLLSSVRKLKNQERKSLKAEINLKVSLQNEYDKKLIEAIKNDLKKAAKAKSIKIVSENLEEKTRVFTAGVSVDFL